MNNYQEKWENRSSIRTRPRKSVDFLQSGNFFPEDKQPLLLLKEISALGNQTKQEILIYSFYKYINDIINLETKAIIRACNLIIDSNLIINYSDEFKLNAYTAIIDEYYHVYMAYDMKLQLDQNFDYLQKLKFPDSDSYSAVQEIKKRLDIKYHDIFEIIAAAVFETTLVKELVEFFKSADVHPSIRYHVSDHMNDESKHNLFFSDLLNYTWANIPQDYRDVIGLHLGEFIKLYLNIISDKEFNYSLLKLFLKDNNLADKLIDSLYNGFKIDSEIPIVKNVLEVFRKAKIFDNENVRTSFASNGIEINHLS